MHRVGGSLVLAVAVRAVLIKLWLVVNLDVGVGVDVGTAVALCSCNGREIRLDYNKRASSWMRVSVMFVSFHYHHLRVPTYSNLEIGSSARPQV